MQRQIHEAADKIVYVDKENFKLNERLSNYHVFQSNAQIEQSPRHHYFFENVYG
jgi:hypothetical protein